MLGGGKSCGLSLAQSLGRDEATRLDTANVLYALGVHALSGG